MRSRRGHAFQYTLERCASRATETSERFSFKGGSGVWNGIREESWPSLALELAAWTFTWNSRGRGFFSRHVSAISLLSGWVKLGPRRGGDQKKRPKWTGRGRGLEEEAQKKWMVPEEEAQIYGEPNIHLIRQMLDGVHLFGPLLPVPLRLFGPLLPVPSFLPGAGLQPARQE